jgi:hypothetical protein
VSGDLQPIRTPVKLGILAVTLGEFIARDTQFQKRPITARETHACSIPPKSWQHEADSFTDALPPAPQGAEVPFSPVVTLRGGSRSRPFFLVHGLGGNALELVSLAQALRTDRAVLAIQEPAVRQLAVALDRYLKPREPAAPVIRGTTIWIPRAVVVRQTSTADYLRIVTPSVSRQKGRFGST